MNQQTYSTRSYVIDPGDREPPECPPEDKYTIKFSGIQAVGLGKPFREGDEPRVQFTLDFKVHAPDPNDDNHDWHNFDLIGWYSPIMHYNPNLPGYTGQKYTEPNLYKLVRALNGGEPIALPTMTDPGTGKARYGQYDAAEELMQFEGQLFRCDIGPSASGWPRLKGDPTPAVKSGTRRRGAGDASTPQPAPVPAGDVAPDDDNPFEDPGL